MVHTSFTQHRKVSNMNTTLEQHLRDMGFMQPTALSELNAVADTRHIYLEKGYFNDPRDRNMEVPF